MSSRVRVENEFGEVEKATFYSSWLYAAIHIYCSLGNGKPFQEIQRHFELESEKLSLILDFLVQTGLCALEDNRYVVGTTSSHVDRKSVHVFKHHLNWRMKAFKKIESLEAHELSFTFPFSISRADFMKSRTQILEIIGQVSKTIETTEPDMAGCLVLDFFEF